MFASSIDALLYAVKNGGSDSLVEVKASIGYMKNGIKRCTVQVSCDGGNGSGSASAGYCIEAYGEEAEALYQEAMKCPSKKEGAYRLVMV